uniref:Uncharacterized protein n=1 Tax=Leersia perrieri TaxID=77586 RepID=A0A0D9Y051_9ORYZ
MSRNFISTTVLAGDNLLHGIDCKPVADDLEPQLGASLSRGSDKPTHELQRCSYDVGPCIMVDAVKQVGADRRHGFGE